MSEKEDDINKDYLDYEDLEWIHWPDERPKKNDTDRLIAIIKFLQDHNYDLGNLRSSIDDLNDPHALRNLEEQIEGMREDIEYLEHNTIRILILMLTIIAISLYIALILTF